MSTIFMRSALVYHGHNPAPDVHSIVIDHRGRHVVTWADVMRERREKQERILRHRRESHPTRAYRVWVAYFDQWLFGGWQAFIENFQDRHSWCSHWIDRDAHQWRRRLMEMFPLLLPLGRNERERFEDWKPAFAEQYRAGSQAGHPRGCVFLWWNGTPNGEIRYAGRPRSSLP